ncbi:hypothetical protein PMAYCL1PPCAC_08371, partial [Pristionchus mayeri]
GCVFKAMHLLDRHSYAVKKIGLNSNVEPIEQTLGEVRKMAKLHHPGIVRYHSTWIEEPPEGWQYRFTPSMEGADQIVHNSGPERNNAFLFIQMEV